ncbi:C39 family peptidase [Virgibacillus kekensis]|uniref:C39 family peptidase n=1 Tax=Virgibacillus kekensis TaxID=202261 RepID=A0ABV9DKI4_9BACI
MHIVLFFVSCFLGLFFILYSEKVSIKWVRKSFKIYSLGFMVTALFAGYLYINQHKAVFSTFSDKMFNTATVTKAAGAPDTMLSPLTIRESVRLSAPQINQLPELPRGCEVTSLAMLLQYSGIEVTKSELANQVPRDNTHYRKTKEGTFFGNPHKGFVGDMYSYNTPGYGVYHGPIAQLAAQYVGVERVHDFSGENFSQIIDQLNQNRPVWVIINAEYRELPEDQFTTWQTEDGPIQITMKEHSVLVTGYDEKFIYFNDPLNRTDKAPINDFKEAWIQMGKQAITVF